MNRKALKFAFMRWLTLSLAPLGCVVAVTVMSAGTTWVTWVLWGALSILMFMFLVFIEHKFGRHD